MLLATKEAVNMVPHGFSCTLAIVLLVVFVIVVAHALVIHNVTSEVIGHAWLAVLFVIAAVRDAKETRRI